MSYRESILFDKSVVEDLNNIFSLLKPYCYFAAYYSPKKAFDNNHEANFWLAVINGYSLIQECSRFLWAFIRKSNNINNYLAEKGDNYIFFSEKERERINHFFCFLKGMRSVYCHNQFPSIKNTNNCKIAIKNIDKYLQNAHFTAHRYDIKDGYIVCKNGQMNLDMWEELTNAICCEAKEVTVIIKRAIETSLMDDTIKKHVAEYWREKVIDWYINSNGECSDYVYEVGEKLAKSLLRGSIFGEKRIFVKEKTISYVKLYGSEETDPLSNMSYKELIKFEMDDIIKGMVYPAKPLEVICEVMESPLFDNI